jgi:hypothetical protein
MRTELVDFSPEVLERKAERARNITPQEIRRRVQAVREELEAYKAQIEAVPFGFASGDMFPECLDNTDFATASKLP